MSATSVGTTPPTGGVTRKIIQKVIYGIVVLVALFLILITALVHHFTFDACANIDGRQKKVPLGFHLEGDDGDRCVANPPPYSPAPKQVKEALVLEKECVTPCSGFVGWSYKIRTDGDPIRIKFQGVSQTVDYPGKGDLQTPKGFQPGDAQFASNEHVKVFIYKRITVPHQ